jgi:hypothetical protein
MAATAAETIAGDALFQRQADDGYFFVANKRILISGMKKLNVKRLAYKELTDLRQRAIHAEHTRESPVVAARVLGCLNLSRRYNGHQAA